LGVLAWNRPDLAVGYKHDEPSVMFATGFLTAIIAFAICWALFAVIHRRAQMCGGLCPVIVAAGVVLIIIAKQITVATTPGVDTIEGQLVAGGEWLAPARFFTSNNGAWIGVIAAILAFREGNSIFEYLPRSGVRGCAVGHGAATGRGIGFSIGTCVAFVRVGPYGYGTPVCCGAS
jgi:hypothetical protein